MIDHRAQLEAALRAVAVTSPTSYAWFGSGSLSLPRAVVAALPSGGARAYLVGAVERELYRSFYSQGKPVPSRPDAGTAAHPDPAFVEQLSRANGGIGGWEWGWRLERVEGATVRVARDGLRVRVRAEDCCGPRRTGAAVRLRRPKELRAGAPGFYTALGDAEPTSQDDIEVRVYLSVTVAGAATLVALCTRLLNEARVPFGLKVVDRPTGFSRCDAAVLYLERGTFARARAALAAIATSCARYLRAESPAFAQPLAPGVAVGEHRPSLGASFGSSRCRLVAEGVVAAHERGIRRLPGRVDAVARRFEAHGLDVDTPYLAAASHAVYEL
jgi:HopA1 effector protein family